MVKPRKSKSDMMLSTGKFKKYLNFVKGCFLEFFILAFIIMLMVAMIFIDVLILHNNVGEVSLTEFLQESFLVTIVSIFGYLAFKYERIRYGMVLIAGLFSCMLIRELDFIFDQIPVLSWFHVAITVTIICFYKGIKHKESALFGLVDFCRSKSFYMMMCGLLTVLVFSRLLGMGILWRNILSGEYQRVMKNVFEEGCESYGYILCIISAVKYLCSKRLKRLNMKCSAMKSLSLFQHDCCQSRN